MVQLMKSGDFHVEREAAAVTCRNQGSMKLETEDFVEQHHAPDSKRSRISSARQQWCVENTFPVPPSLYNPLDEPSPLGLKLRKSPSLLELIQMQLAHGKTAMPVASGETINSDHKEGKSSASSSDKLKASNFTASLLKIGSWEYQSRYEGDLVAKCYFAKHKLVWEVLDAGLKSKIEIQWSDIMGLKADCPETGESSLEVVLARQPLFFRETNPQPRKHTLWQATSDFTNGEASVNRLHFLKFPQGMLHKHFEKLILCDSRLNYLSRQPEMPLDSPYFENSRSFVFEELEPKPHVFDPIKVVEPALGPTGLPDVPLPPMASTVRPTFFKIGQQDLGSRMLEQLPQGPLSPSSVSTMEGFMNQSNDFQGTRKRRKGQNKEPVGQLRPSMSKLDLMNYLDNMVAPVADPSSAEAAERKAQLEHLADILLTDNDSQLPPPTDKQSVMARVNSLCCLLQKESAEGSNSFKENQLDVLLHTSTLGANLHKDNPHGLLYNPTTTLGDSALGMEESSYSCAMKPPTGMMRKDSFSDLLLNLPRIASLPKFLINISEDGENHFK